MNTTDKGFLIMSVFPIWIVLIIIAAIVEDKDKVKDYKEACTKTGGVPVFNGKHHECLKQK